MFGELQRAFYGARLGNNFPLFVHYSVPLWVPEVAGAIDPDNEANDLIVSVFAACPKASATASRPGCMPRCRPGH
ncbi:hypothetical protein [Streptomyces sp. NPDC059994]|uniref:hypothetical protein n=1 Tax=Streptomyces sp. NPDC059994 TaxID=3347029 RepID=UPI00368AE6B5